MYTPQAGIFAQEPPLICTWNSTFTTRRNVRCSCFLQSRRSASHGTTTGGVNFVIGFRPELWRDIVPQDAPAGVHGFNDEIRGTEGFIMPSTQHDALEWLSGSAHDVIFDMARSVVRDLADQASLADETSSWPYRHDRDLTGFIDGLDPPTLLDAPADALLPAGVPGAAGSVLLLQKWKHKVVEWEALAVIEQAADHGANQARQHRTYGQTSGLACRSNGSGHVWAHFVATCNRAVWATTAPCSLDSAQIRTAFPGC